MANVADLVNAVKDRKEKEHSLFDKVDFICRYSGEEYNDFITGIRTYVYEGDNLRFFSQTGKEKEGIFQEVIVQDLNDNVFFRYFTNPSTGKENTEKYIPGRWEKLVEDHYQMALVN